MKYILKHRKLKGSVLIEFAANKVFKSMNIEVEEDVSIQLVRYLFLNLPLHEGSMKVNHYTKVFSIVEVATDLSFKSFWNEYGYKVGRKAQAEKLWNALNDNERAKALGYIKQYNHHLAVTGQTKAYPTSYLNGKYYDNE